MHTAAERFTRRADKAAYTGDYATAIGYLKRAVRLEPNNTRLLMDLASLQNQVAHYEDGIANLMLADALAGDGETHEDIYYLLGEAYFGMSMPQQAEFYLRLSQKEKENGQYSEDCAYLLGELPQLADEKSEEYYNRLNQAEALLAAENYRDASEALQGILQRFGPDWYVHTLLAETFEKLGKLKEALIYVNRALAAKQDSAQAALIGLSCAHKLDNQVRAARYAGVLARLKEYSPADVAALAEYFTEHPDKDLLAKQVFLNLYRDNAFDKGILFGLAAACFNTGDAAYSQELLQKYSLLEGGGGLAEMYTGNPALIKRMPYLPELTPELCRQFADSARDAAQDPCEVLELALYELNDAEIADLLSRLPLPLPPRAEYILRTALLSYDLAMDRKQQVLTFLEKCGAKLPLLVNSGYDIVTGELLGEEDVKTLEINNRLASRYAPQQLMEGLVELWNLELPADLQNTDLTVLLEALICEKYSLPFNWQEKCLQVGADPVLLQALFERKKEK